MGIEGLDGASGLESFTLARVRVLRGLAEGRTEREIAECLHMTYHGVRSHFEVLKELTGCGDVRELGRWWRENRGDWHARLAREAGIVP